MRRHCFDALRRSCAVDFGDGHAQGDPGWAPLADGRIFVVHYTDDSAPVDKGHGSGYGIRWIRGTFLAPEALPRAAAERS